ncbi:MAG: hypothetical protein LBD74_06000 [Spirochaetaceae bacterium]|jgi:hypothetical protein|nr:hypothetical protein [Spirochaetaceae bacterium]
MSEQTAFSKINCVVNSTVTPLIDKALKDLSIPEVYIQQAKQISLLDRSTLLGLRSSTTLEEARAVFYRFYAPPEYETGIMRRIAEAADLYLPGRGSIYAKTVSIRRKNPLTFDRDKLENLAGSKETGKDNYAVIYCIVPRGAASSLAATVLEMGLCVPLISFGHGMGLRDRLGLLRITIPVEKEVIYFIVPKIDAELLESVIIHKARLDLPGQGFLYKTYIRAVAVNLHARRGKRQSAATMEQIIATLDDLRGSSDWRRLEASAGEKGEKAEQRAKEDLTCLSLIAEEGTLDVFGKTALDIGAGGATFINLELRSQQHGGEHNPSSHARQICDLVISNDLKKKILTQVQGTEFFDGVNPGMVEISSAHSAVTYQKPKDKKASPLQGALR